MSSDRNGTAAEIFEAFVDFYGAECSRTGFKPDHTTTRDSRVMFLQRVAQRFCHPYVAMKRGDPGRPISDEAVVICKAGPEYRYFGDFIISGGTADWKLSHHLEGFLPYAQPLVSPLMELWQGANTPGSLVEPLAGGVVPTVPGCQAPAPIPPTPTPAPCFVPSYEGDLGGDAWFRNEIGKPLQADMAAAGQPCMDDGSSVWFSRTIHTIFAECVKAGKMVDRAPIVKKYRNEWRAVLGLPQLP